MDGHPRRPRQRAPGQNPAYRPTPRHHHLVTSRIAPGTAQPAVLTAVALVVVAVMAGCSGANEPSAVLQEQAVVELRCSHAIDAVDDIGRSYAAHGSDGGFVALPSGDLQLGRMGSAGTEFEGFRFSKFGLLVRRDRVLSLGVVNSLGEAVLEYVHPDKPARVVRVGPCPSDREWVVFAGGVWVTEPGCLELVAASGDERLPVRLPVGGPCAGHQ